MTVQSELTDAVSQGDATGEVSLTIALREVVEDGEPYFVATCLEIPGCVSQGDSKEEAEKNIREAIRACVSVIVEDALKHTVARQEAPDLKGIISQRRLRVSSLANIQYDCA
jgi:predicted RNase H-like HicB family nuclease